MTREDLINQRATTCRHGGHCEWVACDKCNHYEPDGLNQQPCEDCISRQATVRKLCKVADFMNEKREGLGSPYIMAALFIQDNKDEFPPVTPKEKTGHWIIKDGKEQGYDIAGVKTWYIQIMCDKCGFINSAIEGHTGQYHFCPNCGAKMQEVENDD